MSQKRALLLHYHGKGNSPPLYRYVHDGGGRGSLLSYLRREGKKEGEVRKGKKRHGRSLSSIKKERELPIFFPNREDRKLEEEKRGVLFPLLQKKGKFLLPIWRGGGKHQEKFHPYLPAQGKEGENADHSE